MSRTWRPPEANTIDPPDVHWKKYKGYQKLINSKTGQVDDEELENHIEEILEKTPAPGGSGS